MSEEEITAVCGQLAAAVEVMTSPTAPREQRLEAFHKCEEFKQKSPLGVRCGLALSRPSTANPLVRHFGLKILEDVIKLRWNEMSPEQKLFLKESALAMIDSGTGDLAREAPHIKDAVSRLVVEIIKREWPQHWPALLGELDALCRQGETQTEMVMLVLLRLVEDVAVLQTLEQTQRRKEIYQALTLNMEEIFKFLLQLLEKHYQAYLGGRQAGDAALAGRHCKVCQAVLGTFTAFVEWVAISHIMANDKYLVRCLCHLLSDEKLQLPAAECLLGIVSWKAGKAQDRIQLLALFKTDMMAPLFQATERANERALDEDHYNFLKKMVQILAELGGQLCALWSKDGAVWKQEVKDRQRPENFDVYLNALLAFSNHPSQTLNLFVNDLWIKFFRHADICKDDVFKNYIAKWTALACKKCVKVGYPTRDDSVSCSYSLLDFDTDEEFSAFFARYRINIVEGIKLISVENPGIPFLQAEMWLKQLLTQPPDFGKDGKGDGKCRQNSPIVLELDGISTILEHILAKRTREEMEPISARCLELTKMCLEYRAVGNPLLASALLSCISSLFVVVGHYPDTMLMPTLNKIFECITYTDAAATGAGASKQFSDEARALRRHACSLMVKLGTRQPKVLLPLFSHLRDSILEMKSAGRIMPMEFSTLVEALVLISNEFGNFQMQSQFINTVCEPVCKQFTSLESSISDPLSFIDFVGLSKPPPATPETPDPRQQNRSDLNFCTIFLLSVCRRAATPADLANCQTGGFVAHSPAEQQTVGLRNPAWAVAASVLRHVFMLTKTLNGLWSPEAAAKMHPYYSPKVLTMLQSERDGLTGHGHRRGKNSPENVRSPLSRMQSFLFELYENSYHYLSQWCNTSGHDFYQTPQLATGIVEHAFSNLNLIPDFRLRAINRIFVKSLINKCPKAAYASVMAPVFLSLCPYMLNRLNERWKHLKATRELPSFDEDNADSQEVVEEVVCRHLAREYLDVVKAILTSGGGTDVKVSDMQKRLATNGDANGNSEDSNGATPEKNSQKLALSELGHLVVQHESLRQCITATLLGALVWPDSPSSLRATSLLELVLPLLAQNRQLTDADANNIMYTVLSALHELGQHELNYIGLTQLAINAYEWLRPYHPSIVGVLAQVPGCQPADLQRFDDKMMAILGGKENVQGGDRTKKDMFKKLIVNIIGKDVGKMFKHEVVIRNLPTMMDLRRPKHKTPSLDETEKKDIGIASLFGGQANGQ